MGRPKIKTIESDFDLEKVKLPEEQTELPELSAATEEKVKKQAKAAKKQSKDKVEKKNKVSKRFAELIKAIDKSKEYSLEEAVELVKKTANVKFDSSVEAHINLRIDSSKQEQQIRTTTNLPFGSGKKVRILVFGAKDTKEIKELGAEAGDEETLGIIEKGKIDFDKVVASPDWMPKLAKVAKVLGPKGLMPNPKSGTVSPEPEKVVKGLSTGGLIEIKTESSPIIHVVIGKVSAKNKDLEENVKSLLIAVNAAKPSDVKKELVKSVFLSSTMGPSLKLDRSSLG